MFKGFKDFLLRGNVIDLSVAVVIGAAFTDVVTAFTNSFLKPLIQLLSPGVGEFAGTVRVDGVVFDYATVINQTITFVITAGVVYFLVVAPMKAIQARRLRGEEAGPAEPTDVELLTQIRDLLEDQATRGSAGSPGYADAAPVGPERTLAERAPVERLPERAPAERAPAERVPAERAPAERAPAEGAPAERVPAERVPAAVGAVADANSTSPVLPPTRVPASAGPSAGRPHPVAAPYAMADAAPTRRARPASSGPPPQFAEAPAGSWSSGPPRHGRSD